jgi:excisionase family DNA binding protein
MYTVKEASEKLGLSEGQIRRLLRKDEIKGEKLGRDWLVLSLEFRMFSVNEASRKLGLGPSQVRRLLASGKIKGKKFGRDWVVLSLDYTRKRKTGLKTRVSKN